MIKLLWLTIVAVVISALAWVYFAGITPPVTEVTRALVIPPVS